MCLALLLSTPSKLLISHLVTALVSEVGVFHCTRTTEYGVRSTNVEHLQVPPYIHPVAKTIAGTQSPGLTTQPSLAPESRALGSPVSIEREIPATSWLGIQLIIERSLLKRCGAVPMTWSMRQEMTTYMHLLSVVNLTTSGMNKDRIAIERSHPSVWCNLKREGWVSRIGSRDQGQSHATWGTPISRIVTFHNGCSSFHRAFLPQG